jgi:uncharacterized protein GlcG (DUF336 family)
MHDLSLEMAEIILETAKRRAEKIKVQMNIAIVDVGGNLKAFRRMDGAWLGSIDIAIRKARTARFFDMDTGDLGKLSKPGAPAYMIEVSNGGLITFPGGVPLQDANGQILGAIGVSGGLPKQDQDVAEEGAEAFEKLSRRSAA